MNDRFGGTCDNSSAVGSNQILTRKINSTSKSTITHNYLVPKVGETLLLTCAGKLELPVSVPYSAVAEVDDGSSE